MMAGPLEFLGRAPSVRITSSTVEIKKVHCPYCKVGSTDVIGERGSEGKLQIEGFREPRKCNNCGKLFKLTARVVVEGAPLEE